MRLRRPPGVQEPFEPGQRQADIKAGQDLVRLRACGGDPDKCNTGRFTLAT